MVAVTAGALPAQPIKDGTPQRCTAIPVPASRQPVQQFLTLSLLDEVRDRGRVLDFTDRSLAQQLVDRLASELIVAPPSPFTEEVLGLSMPFTSLQANNPVMVPDVGARIDAMLHRDGRMSNVRLGRPSARPSADTVLWRSFRDPLTTLPLADYAARLTDDSIAIRVETSVQLDADSTSVKTPLQMLELPTFVGQMARLARVNEGPRYPPDLRAAGKEGFVLTSFYIDVDGKVDLSTLQILRTSHPAFAAAVRAALTHFQYAPSVIGDCGVRQWVQQPFNFSIGRPPG